MEIFPDEDCFHLGVKALIRNREGKILLLQGQSASSRTFWDIPGGRLKRGETMLDALQRELEEEVGLKGISVLIPLNMHLTNVRIPSHGNDVGLILSIYRCDLDYDFTPKLSYEHIHFDWFNVVDAVQLLKPRYPASIISDVIALEPGEHCVI
ncbi:MAG: NUDIX domain-containing protein [Chlamydiia bacterium]|nr:NUDIX domain-containing protein [Chlamydiia bacterium]MCP5509493.1 NUDIX domain-containing protein [Chlamydiales bacterium]